MGVGAEVAQSGAADVGVRVGDVADAHVQHGPVPRRDGDAAPVGVVVVGRESVLDVVARVVGIGVPRRGLRLPVRPPLRVARPLRAGMVRVDRVRERRDHHRNGCRGRPLRRHHEEGDVLPRCACLEHQRVGRRADALGHRPLESDRPAAVLDVVFVKVDGGIFVRRVPPAHLAAVPPRAGHSPGRDVDEPAVQSVRAGVLDATRLDATREVPSCARIGDGASMRDIVDLVCGQRPIEHRRRLELAVEVPGRTIVVHRREQQRGVHCGRRTGRERRAHGLRRMHFPEPRRQRRPSRPHLAGLRVHDKPHGVPCSFDQRTLDRRHVTHRRPVADRRTQPVSLVDRQTESARRRVGARDDRLPRAGEPRRVDEARHREAARPETGPRIFDASVRAVRRTLLARDLARHRGAFDRLQDDAGPGGVRVRTDDAHDLRVDIGAGGVAEMKSDRLSGTNRQAIGITSQGQHDNWLLGSASGIAAGVGAVFSQKRTGGDRPFETAVPSTRLH